MEEPEIAPRSPMIELAITVAIVGILGVIVAQCLALSLREKSRTAAHQLASELAVNVLEEARAQPFEKLDKAWADARTLSAEAADMLPNGKLAVTVESEKAASQSRRVTVEVHWQFDPQLPTQSVRLTTLLSAREAKKGATP